MCNFSVFRVYLTEDTGKRGWIEVGNQKSHERKEPKG
jgi:hypothetical protein